MTLGSVEEDATCRIPVGIDENEDVEAEERSKNGHGRTRERRGERRQRSARVKVSLREMGREERNKTSLPFREVLLIESIVGKG